MQQPRSLFGPLLLIAAGAIWLLVKSGNIAAGNLWALTHIWPYLLIAAGVGILLRPYWKYTSLVLDVAIIGGGVLAIVYAPQMGWDNPSIVSFGNNGNFIVGPGTPGSGNVIPQTREVGNFASIRVDYPAQVFITQGAAESVKIEAEDNVLPGLKTQVSNKTLEIFYRVENNQRVNPTKLVKVTIVVKDLSRVDFSSAGELNIAGVKSDTLNISLSGAGNLKLNDIEVQDLTVNLSGAGSMTASGTADALDMNISGFGSFDGKDLHNQTAKISLSGAGSAIVWVDENLDAEISGAGSVNYYGSPTVTKQIGGLGSVKGMGDK
jgi:hypothetical protein